MMFQNLCKYICLQEYWFLCKGHKVFLTIKGKLGNFHMQNPIFLLQLMFCCNQCNYNLNKYYMTVHS